MFLPLEILQNFLMGIGSLARLAGRYHSTGLNANRTMARQVFEFYCRFQSAEGKDILEIGPGHTLEVLEEALASGAKSCTAVDVVGYLSADQAARRSIAYRLYDGMQLPFASQQFDLVWSYTAFEHLRYPAVTIAECFRVLRAGGSMVALIDLGDHSYYQQQPPQPLKLFDCLRYPEWLWNLMKWNRSSYMNRLRKSEWKQLFQQTGFVIRAEESRVSDEIDSALPTLHYLHKYSHDDAVTHAITLWLEKPRLTAS